MGLGVHGSCLRLSALRFRVLMTCLHTGIRVELIGLKAKRVWAVWLLCTRYFELEAIWYLAWVLVSGIAIGMHLHDL